MSSEQEAMSFETEGLYVSESERQGWWSIARIWIGNAFNVSSLISWCRARRGPHVVR